MSTQQIDTLLRRLDVPAQPDASFVASSLSVLEVRARAARRRDSSWLGRLRRDSALILTPTVATSRSVRLAGVIALIVLALVAGLVIVGALYRPPPIENGPLIVSVKGQLEAIDPVTGRSRSILPGDVKAEGVSRSPDGRLATFWSTEAGRSRLFEVGVNGGDRRELVSGLTVAWNSEIDSWSPDSRFLATGVTFEGTARILIVDVETGIGTAATPPAVGAHNPLWSPDGAYVAFQRETSSGHALSEVGRDGFGMHDISGLRGLDVDGPDTWSPDGQWIYFGAFDGHGFRAYCVDVLRGHREQLSGGGQSSPGIASSPDGKMIGFNVDGGADGWDVWIANSDGSDRRLLLRSALIGGWSADSRLVLSTWRPSDEPGGLVSIRPDGTGKTVLVPFDASCRNGWDETCELGFGWGVPRP